MGTTSLSILFLIALVAVTILTLLLSQKKDTITSLEIRINELEQEIKEQVKEKALLNKTLSNLKEDKAELAKDRKNIIGRLNYAKSKLEEERRTKRETDEHLNGIIVQLNREKKQIQENLEYTNKTKSLTIEKQIDQLSKLEKELNKTKESLKSTIQQNEEYKKLISSLEETNKELESIICELKSQISQVQKEFKKAQTQMQIKNDNPFERMATW